MLDAFERERDALPHADTHRGQRKAPARAMQLVRREVREIQTALGLVAAEFGACAIPSSLRLCRVNGNSKYIAPVKQLITEMHVEQPSWLDTHNLPTFARCDGMEPEDVE